MPKVEEHTNCCGITHLIGFPASFDRQTKKEIEEQTLEFCLGERKRRRTRCNLVEVTLNGTQMRAWDKHLKDIGYKKVSEFRNMNSGI